MDSTPFKPPPCRPFSGVRIVGRVRPLQDPHGGSSDGFPISVDNGIGDGASRRCSSVVVHGPKSREPYKLDYCYKQDDNLEQIFEHEVKPLINHAMEGRNSAIIAYGARDTGKSFTIKGSDERPGLASMAVAELFSMGEESKVRLTVSFYEVYQDHVFDLLSTKEQEVLVLEGNGGRITFKGLSQVQVNSVADFNSLHLPSYNQKEPLRRLGDNLRISHKGVIIHVSHERTSITSQGKLNFIDLAGYEDPKQFSSESFHLAENAKVNNKSLYALHNVIYAINAIENWIPFRESKLTRLLQDYMGRTSSTLLITCLSPKVSQDMIQTLSFSSRSCLAGNQIKPESCKKVKNKVEVLANFCSPMAYRCKTPLTSSMKKPTISKSNPPERRVKHVSFEGNEKRGHVSEINFCDEVVQIHSGNDEKSGEMTEIYNERTTLLPNGELDTTMSNIRSLNDQIEDDHYEIELVTPQITYLDSPKGCQSEIPALNKGSPPLSAQLKEITNTLKSISSTPIRAYAITPSIRSCNLKMYKEMTERKTILPFDTDNNFDQSIMNIPHDGSKVSLVDLYLRFFNLATKEELKQLQGIGEKRADYIMKRREISPQPFKSLDDIKEIGLSAKQVRFMMEPNTESIKKKSPCDTEALKK